MHQSVHGYGDKTYIFHSSIHTSCETGGVFITWYAAAMRRDRKEGGGDDSVHVTTCAVDI